MKLQNAARSYLYEVVVPIHLQQSKDILQNDFIELVYATIKHSSGSNRKLAADRTHRLGCVKTGHHWHCRSPYVSAPSLSPQRDP